MRCGSVLVAYTLDPSSAGQAPFRPTRRRTPDGPDVQSDVHQDKCGLDAYAADAASCSMFPPGIVYAHALLPRRCTAYWECLDEQW